MMLPCMTLTIVMQCWKLDEAWTSPSKGLKTAAILSFSLAPLNLGQHFRLLEPWVVIIILWVFPPKKTKLRNLWQPISRIPASNSRLSSMLATLNFLQGWTSKKASKNKINNLCRKAAFVWSTLNSHQKSWWTLHNASGLWHAPGVYRQDTRWVRHCWWCSHHHHRQHHARPHQCDERPDQTKKLVSC